MVLRHDYSRGKNRIYVGNLVNEYQLNVLAFRKSSTLEVRSSPVEAIPPSRVYHWASAKLANGSIAEPGNWGRMLRRYSMSLPNGARFGIPWTFSRETLIETVRAQMFPEMPSRLSASFSLLSYEDAMAYRQSQDHYLLNMLCEVELRNPDAPHHVGSLNWIKELVSHSPLRVMKVLMFRRKRQKRAAL